MEKEPITAISKTETSKPPRYRPNMRAKRIVDVHEGTRVLVFAAGNKPFEATIEQKLSHVKQERNPIITVRTNDVENPLRKLGAGTSVLTARMIIEYR